MIQIKDIHEANSLLAKYMPLSKALLGKDLTLARMTPLMNFLGNPQDKLNIIHIAGTSGKTSTAYYIANLLKQSGNKVGMTVSPHVDSVTERLQINLEPLSEPEFCFQLSEFVELLQSKKFQPTYFELLVSFAYWYFEKQKVDYAVMETGLGGLQDATNVAGKNNKICIITDIGLDHLHVLGKTLTEIATQKAGIIHSNNQVFMYQQDPSVMEVFEGIVSKKHATLNLLRKNMINDREPFLPNTGIMPDFQKRNWLLAKFVFNYVSSRDGLPALSDENLLSSTQITVPGRMDIMQIGEKTLIMDGAHNEQKMQNFVSSFINLYPGKTADVLLSLKSGKEYQDVLRLLLPICSSLTITTFDILQDLPIKSIDPETLFRFAKSIGFLNIEIIENPKLAYHKLIESKGSVKIITGSFYLLSCVRPYIINSND